MAIGLLLKMKRVVMLLLKVETTLLLLLLVVLLLLLLEQSRVWCMRGACWGGMQDTLKKHTARSGSGCLLLLLWWWWPSEGFKIVGIEVGGFAGIQSGVGAAIVKSVRALLGPKACELQGGRWRCRSRLSRSRSRSRSKGKIGLQ